VSHLSIALKCRESKDRPIQNYPPIAAVPGP
jgi:hypothetical protein